MRTRTTQPDFMTCGKPGKTFRKRDPGCPLFLILPASGGCEFVQDIGREDREKHHAHERQQHAEEFSDRRNRENSGTDGRHIHPGPPKGVAEAVKSGIDRSFVIIEDQRRDVGKDDNGEDIGRQQPPHVVVHEPPHDDNHGQKGPQQRYQAKQHSEAARKVDAGPMDQIEVGNRYEQEQQVVQHEVRPALRGGPTQEKITQKDHADHELDMQESRRKGGAVASEDLPRYGGQKRQTGKDLDRTERVEQIFMGSPNGSHVVSFLPTDSKSMPRPLTKRFHPSEGVFWPKFFADMKFSITFALAFQQWRDSSAG